MEPFHFTAFVRLTNPLLSFRITIQLLPKRPQPITIQALLTFTPPLFDPGSNWSRPVGSKAAKAAEAGNSNVIRWLKLVLVSFTRLPESAPLRRPEWAAIDRAAVKAAKGRRKGVAPFHFTALVLLTNPLLSFRITLQRLPNRPQPAGSQAQLQIRLKSSSPGPA